MAKLMKKKSVEERIVGGLSKFAEALERGESITERFTSRTVVLDLASKDYTPKQVQATRKLLNASQSVFAQFLGVSVATVRAWEQGKNAPNEIASRFMDEIQHNPDYMRTRLRESVRRREAVRVK